MRLPRLISLNLLLLLIAQKVCAQLAPADDFFNSGAEFYISNNIPSALEKVENGLKIYPNDIKLKKLEELLKQQQQQSQNSQSQQNQSQQNSSDQKNQQQQNQQQQNSQAQQKPEGQKQNQPEQQKSSTEKQEN